MEQYSAVHTREIWHSTQQYTREKYGTVLSSTHERNMAQYTRGNTAAMTQIVSQIVSRQLGPRTFRSFRSYNDVNQFSVQPILRTKCSIGPSIDMSPVKEIIHFLFDHSQDLQ